MVMLVGSVFLVQGIDDQADAAKAQGKNESRKHGMPPLEYVLVQKHRRDPP
jgi:hypothetical protein